MRSVIAEMDVPALHLLVYRQLLPALAAQIGESAAHARLLRFKVLGGLGPAATADFLQELLLATPANSDREHLRLDISVEPFMGRDAPMDVMQAALDRLLRDGQAPTAFCLPCNSAHWREPQLAYDRERVTFVSMVDATVEALAQLAPAGGVGLLATRQMVASGAYQAALAAAGLVAVVPDDALQRRIDVAIYGGEIQGRRYPGIKGGDAGQHGTALVQSVLDALRAGGRVQAVCLACTELPLVFGPQRDGTVRGDAAGLAVVSSTRALAHAFVRQALCIQAQLLGDSPWR